MNDFLDIRKIRKNSRREEATAGYSKQNKFNFFDFLNKDIRFGSSRINDRTRENIYAEILSLLEAGVDIRSALELVIEGQKKQKLKGIFEEIRDLIISGSTFSMALKKAREFSSYEIHSIQIGEETGKLLDVLKELSGYFAKKIKQRRQIVGAVTYPIVVLVVAFGAVSFMVTYVVPMFADTFRRFGSDLPAITKAVISMSGFIKEFFGIFLMAITGLILFCIWQAKKVWFRKISSAIILKTPIIGKIIQRIYLSRFANTMSLLIGARIPILQAIQLTRQMITFYPIERSLFEIEEKIIAGEPLYKSLSFHTVYPPKMISIIKVGEEVNQLELFFARLAEQYSNEVEYQTTLLSKFLEPLIIIILGIIVGTILIAMYLPLFRLGQTF